MRLVSAFKDFDPLEGKPSCFHNEALANIAYRARKILKGRSSDEIRYGHETLQWIISEGTIPISSEIMQRGAYAETGEYDYLPSSLFLEKSMSVMDISGQEGFLNAMWPEYFAILALALVGKTEDYVRDSIKELRIYLGQEANADEVDVQRYKKIGELAVEAMEAICKAEALLGLDVVVEDKVSEKISLKNKKAAIIKNGATNKLKEEFIRYCIKEKSKNISHAARVFYNKLPAEKKSIIEESNHVIFFTRAFRSYKKGEFTLPP